MACIQSSDSQLNASPPHCLDGIGSRFTSLKIQSDTIASIRQALLDPTMRVKISGDHIRQPSDTIESLRVAGGFFDGVELEFNPDLNCLIGGTGVGKSLTIELIRFATGQQTPIPKLMVEVNNLLAFALGEGGTVILLVRRNDTPYVIKRTFTKVPENPRVFRVSGEQEEEIDNIDMPTFFPIKAFSQSEVIEFARDSSARRTLVDDLIDISEERGQISRLKGELRANATNLMSTQEEIEGNLDRLKQLPGVRADIAKLSAALSDPRLESHEHWRSDRRYWDAAEHAVTALLSPATPAFGLSISVGPETVPEHSPRQDLLRKLATRERKLRDDLALIEENARATLQSFATDLSALSAEFNSAYNVASAEYERLLESMSESFEGDVVAADQRLHRLKEQELELLELQRETKDLHERKIRVLENDRNALLDSLQAARRKVFATRNAKASELTKNLGARVRVEVEKDADGTEFLRQLIEIKKGSGLRDDDMRVMSETLHPVRFVKSMLSEDYEGLEKASGVSASTFQKLAQFILGKKRISAFYDLQIVDTEDVVDAKFNVGSSAGESFRELSKLAHGQKCTVILMIALAEGRSPVLADQPEDALHIMFIENSIVEAIRDLRGLRQFLFSTRSANILVSGDAEHVIVLESDADHGWIRRQGCIDNFDTRDLIILNLEGGEEAFKRRTLKYGFG